MKKTIVRLNDAAMTLATMLISRDEYRTMAPAAGLRSMSY
eukprot:COSAG02_NODE_5569_length_4224_cov_1.810424_1_plen_40_part_00